MTDTLLEARTPLAAEELRLMDTYWHACNYLSLGMPYLRENRLERSTSKND